MDAALPRHMLVISHTARAEAIEATRIVVQHLREQEVAPVMTASDRSDYAPHLDMEEVRELHRDVPLSDIEVAIVLGGDGTILRAAEVVRGSACPVATVNLGHVGFLAEMEAYDLDTILRAVLSGEYTVEERVTLDVAVFSQDTEVVRTFAVNEATVEKRERMIEVSIGVDRRPLSTFGCDGVVMSTPTGSTAYAFSVGGPILWPGVNAMLIAPIAAHALFNRPVVVSPDTVLEAQLSPTSPGAAYLWCDGRRKVPLEPGMRVEVRRADEPVRLARITRGNFTDRLVKKFRLPVTGWRTPDHGADA